MIADQPPKNFILDSDDNFDDSSDSSRQQQQPQQSSSSDDRDLLTVKEYHRDEEDYSDDAFDEVNNTVETVRKRDVSNLLMTATAEQLDVLKQSLSNFKEATKPAQAQVDDEYIEEIFEDD